MLWRRPYLHGLPFFIDSDQPYQSRSRISWPPFSVIEVVAGATLAGDPCWFGGKRCARSSSMRSGNSVLPGQRRYWENEAKHPSRDSLCGNTSVRIHPTGEFHGRS